MIHNIHRKKKKGNHSNNHSIYADIETNPKRQSRLLRDERRKKNL